MDGQPNDVANRSPLDAAAKLEALESVFAALAHGSRRQILMVIHFRGGEMTAGDIAARFEHSWPTISRHLKVLEAALLVDCERRGRSRVYRVNRDRFGVVGRWLQWFDGSKEQP